MSGFADLFIALTLVAIVICFFIILLRCVFNSHYSYTHKIYQIIEMKEDEEVV